MASPSKSAQTKGSPHKNLILFISCMAVFMTVVDLAIVNVALPTMQRQLGLSQSSLQWIVVAYGLLFGGFLLLGGRLGDVFGRRRTLLTGLSLFTIASLVAGMSHSIGLLIASRGVQGFAAALIAPSALSILAAAFPEGKERNKALGIYGAVGGASASVGVVASGLLTDGPGWRWIFYVNVPVGIFLTLLAARTLTKDVVKKGEHELDAKTAVAATGGLLALIYALNKGNDFGWMNWRTAGLFALALGLLALFVGLERRSHAPLLPSEALKNRTMVVADLIGLFAFGGFFGFIFLTTLLMQQQLGYTAIHTGVVWLITSLSAFVAAGLTGGVLAIRFGTKRLLLIALAALAATAFLLARLPAVPNFSHDLLPPFLLAGLSIGLVGPSVQISALTGVNKKTFGVASGLVETARELGGVIVIAGISTVLVARSKHAAQLSAPMARKLALLDGFHAAYAVIGAAAVVGFLVALALKVKTPTNDEAAAALASSETGLLDY